MKINSNEIKILYSFFDQIIPSDELMPSATAVISLFDFEKLLLENNKYKISLDQIIYFIKKEPNTRVAGGPSSLSEPQKVEIIKLMEALIPNDLLMFIEIIYLLYYSKKEVHEKIGWNPDEFAEENKMHPFDSSILKNIKKRDPFWRKV